MFIVKTVKNCVEQIKIGWRLGWYDSKSPMDNLYYAVYSSDRTELYIRAEGKIYKTRASDTFMVLPSLWIANPHIYTVHKNFVNLPD